MISGKAKANKQVTQFAMSGWRIRDMNGTNGRYLPVLIPGFYLQEQLSHSLTSNVNTYLSRIIMHIRYIKFLRKLSGVQTLKFNEELNADDTMIEHDKTYKTELTHKTIQRLS